MSPFFRAPSFDEFRGENPLSFIAVRVFWLFRGYLDERVDRGALLRLADAVSAKGAQMFILTGHRCRKSTPERVFHLCSPGIPLLNHLAQCASAFLVLLRKMRPGDVLLVEPYMVVPALFFAILSRWGFLRHRVILDVRTMPVERESLLFALDLAMFRLGLFVARSLFDGAILVAETMREALGHYLSGLRTGIVTPVVDMGLFDPEKYRSTAVKEKLGLEGKTIFLYWGSLDSRGRGLVEAARAFRDSSLPDAVLVFAGKGNQKNEIIRAGGPSVMVIPPVAYEDVPGLVAAADFAVIPFTRTPAVQKGYPIKLLEALAMEKPVVATDVNPVRELLEGKDFWFAASSTGDLGRAFAMAYEKRHSVRASGARRIAGRFSASAQAMKLLAFLGNQGQIP